MQLIWVPVAQVSYEVQVSCHGAVVSAESSTGERFASKLVPVAPGRIHFPGGYWAEGLNFFRAGGLPQSFARWASPLGSSHCELAPF